MLKLNYTEAGLYMERVVTPLELTIAQRVVLAMRLGQPLSIAPGHASFLLPASLPGLEQLELALRQEDSSTGTVMPADDELVEVSLSGTWVAESVEAQEGIFLIVLADRTEFFIYKLWQMSEVHLNALTF